MTLDFRIVEKGDIVELVKLINSAYREQGRNSWTTEAEIVVGNRINHQQLENFLAQEKFQLFVAELNRQLVACIGLTFSHSEVEIGTFCIALELQNCGIGKLALNFVEKYVQNLNLIEVKSFVMWVLSVRHELIAYYERRGYVQTGIFADYPFDANVGIPIVNLHLVEMKKAI